MSEHAAPPPETEGDDALVSSASNRTLKVAATLHAVSGLLSALTGVQVLTSVVFREPLISAVPGALFLLGVAQIVVGSRVYRARYSATVGALGIALTLVLVAAGWLVFALADALLSCIAMLAPLAALASVGTGILALGPAKRAEAARQRLLDQGLDLGL